MDIITEYTIAVETVKELDKKVKHFENRLNFQEKRIECLVKALEKNTEMILGMLN